MAGLERTREILSESREDADPRRTVAIGPVRGEVVFENVGFAYSEGKPVLHDVSFLARPGSVTALVGPSGAGKSTIIGLIAAFHVPTSGLVLVDGMDWLPCAWTATMHAARRGPAGHLSVRRNHPRQRRILQARRERGGFSGGLPHRPGRRIRGIVRRTDGYDTVVGERGGVRLSGGQRQRISIARAILADPRILILDEATSSLDSESEALIQEGLSYLMRRRTAFVISASPFHGSPRRSDPGHRTAGRIIERGNHGSLLCASAATLLRSLHETTRLRWQENLFPRAGRGQFRCRDDSETERVRRRARMAPRERWKHGAAEIASRASPRRRVCCAAGTRKRFRADPARCVPGSGGDRGFLRLMPQERRAVESDRVRRRSRRGIERRWRVEAVSASGSGNP